MSQVRLEGAAAPVRVGKIVCVARNYAAHARELGNDVPAEPVLFMKPATSIVGDGGTVVIPAYGADCHHEIELAVLIGRGGRRIAAEHALEHVAGYGVALDMTLRDVQTRLKAAGLPWEQAKGFDTACPLSTFVPPGAVPDPHALRLTLRVDGEVRQDGRSDAMLHSIPALIAFISRIFTLEAGDVILTGTPSGVGPVRPGESLDATIEGVGRLRVAVAAEN